jgi:hypothetical protein
MLILGAVSVRNTRVPVGAAFTFETDTWVVAAIIVPVPTGPLKYKDPMKSEGPVTVRLVAERLFNVAELVTKIPALTTGAFRVPVVETVVG